MNLHIQHLRTGYGERLFVEVEDLEIGTGKIVSLIGENGCGKSTFLKALVGLLPYEGRIQMNGCELSCLSTKERARLISYLPQHLLAPEMDVSQLLAHGRYARGGDLPYGRRADQGHCKIGSFAQGCKEFFGEFAVRLREEDRQIMTKASEMTGIDALQNTLLRKLSGGERQLAYLAMTIAQDADLLLLDEPATYMDIRHRLRLGQILQELKAEGKTVLMTTHDIAEGFSVSDEMIVMQEGHFMIRGSPEDLCKEKELLRKILGISLMKDPSEEAVFQYKLAR